MKKKNKVVTGNTPFFVISHFVLHICFWQGSFVWHDEFSVLVLSTKNGTSIFLKYDFAFQKIYLKIKVLKTFKISSDCHIITCRSLKWKAILKIPTIVF